MKLVHSYQKNPWSTGVGNYGCCNAEWCWIISQGWSLYNRTKTITVGSVLVIRVLSITTSSTSRRGDTRHQMKDRTTGWNMLSFFAIMHVNDSEPQIMMANDRDAEVPDQSNPCHLGLLKPSKPWAKQPTPMGVHQPHQSFSKIDQWSRKSPWFTMLNHHHDQPSVTMLKTTTNQQGLTMKQFLPYLGAGAPTKHRPQPVTTSGVSYTSWAKLTMALPWPRPGFGWPWIVGCITGCTASG